MAMCTTGIKFHSVWLVALLIYLSNAATLTLSDENSRPFPATPQPLIIDTDIGSFYDDFMALALAVKSPSVDVKLVVTCTDNTTARAKIAAKLLTLFGRSDIPIGIGVQNENVTKHPLFGWAEDFDLSTYEGGILQDGVAGMAKVIQNSISPVDILLIGPMTNFPQLLSQYPDVVKNSRVKVSGGSIFKGYGNSSQPAAEYNIAVCPYCAKEVFHAGWNISIAPLDTTGVGTLTPPLMREFLQTTNSIALAVGNSLLYYCSDNPYRRPIQCEFNVTTPIFFDAVATMQVLPTALSFFEFKELNITVTNEGYTVIDNKMGTCTTVALYWNGGSVGLGHYREFLTSTLSS